MQGFPSFCSDCGAACEALKVTQTQFFRPLLVGSLLVALVAAGCHRGYYRRMADQEAVDLVQQKAVDPRWQTATGEIDVAPESRMFNPFSQDHPPLPPDDPHSAEFMDCVDGRPGYPHWHANGDTSYVENPEWRHYLPLNDRGEVEIDFVRAYELALIHSNNYQRQREELYLTALDVALERFGFDSQFFAGFNSFLATEGRFRSGNSRSTLSGSLGANGGGINYRKLGITGATYTVGLANSILWNFAGNTTQSASSLVNFSIVQPLMRGAGRDRIMESLTQAERDLLGNVRQFERFRQGFFLEVTVGRPAGSTLARNGGSFLSNPTTASAAAGGLMGLLQAQQNILNQEINVKYLEDVVEQFREFQARDRVDALQVKQTEQTLFNAQSNLLNLKTSYQNDLDRYKILMGLPPRLPLIVNDNYLGHFRLISLPIQDRQRRVIELRKVTGDQLNAADALLPGTREAAAAHQWTAELDAAIADLEPFLQQALLELHAIQSEDRGQLQQDFQRLAAIRPERVDYLARLRAKVASGEMLGDIDPAILLDTSIPVPEKLQAALDSTLENLSKVDLNLQRLIANVQAAPQQKVQLDPVQYYDFITNDLLFQVADQLTQLNNLLIEVSLTQALARANSIGLANVEMDSETATEIARCFRLDWMNARAALVDNWRQIEFVADQLESQFDLVLEGNMGNVGDNPFRIHYETGQLRGGFRFDTPIVRMNERNQYRESLIRYQRARRSFYLFEDEISRNLRLTLRTLDQFKIQFELSRRNVQTAIEQFEIARLRLDQPTRAGGGGGGGAIAGGGGAAGGGGGGGGANALGATAARDLLGAITNLQNAQDQFMRIWVQYEVLRRGLDYDLGTMILDEQGRWVDPGTIDREIGYRVAAYLGLDPACLDCGLPQNMQAFDQKMRLDQAPGNLPSESESGGGVVIPADAPASR